MEDRDWSSFQADDGRIVRALRMLVAAVGVLALLAGCGSDAGAPTASSPEEPSPTASESPSPEPESPLEGTWRTRPVSPGDTDASLREYGLAKWIKRFRPLTPFKDDTVLILVIEDEWDLYGKTKGEPRVEIDYDAEYFVNDKKVVVRHSNGSRTLRWSVDGDTLTLESLKTSLPPYKGVPDEVFQIALYATGDFKRQS
jgi:hypothetical protein